MKITKTNPILRLVNDFMIDSPAPSNINYLWNFGSLLGINLVLMIITGCALAMHYNPSTAMAFNSVEHIMRNVQSGWLIRYLHANGASFFLFWTYLHIARGLYYGSYRAPRRMLWSIGVIILVLMIGCAF
jgi:ubiquinol-cytochrome c reductase cytochrome b subunit